MKRLPILFSFLFLLIPGLMAQNYECIKSSSIHHFSGDNANTVLSIRIDSVRQNGDTTFFYNYYMLRPNADNWYWTIKGNSWTGRKIIRLPGEMWLFFNGNNDTLFVNCAAEINDTWRFCTLSDSSYYTATISEICEEVFIGITDTVKKISLEKFNAAGQPVVTPINNMQLSLSKNFGFVTLLNFDAFEYIHPHSYWDPFNEVATLRQYHIFGMNSPQAGWQNITAYEVFGSNHPGDEIHFNRASEDYHSYNSSGELSVYKFIERNEFLNGDSVAYKIDRCYYYRNSYADNTSRHYVHDTIIRGFQLANHPINILSLEPLCKGDMVETYVKTQNSASNVTIMLYGCSENSEFIIFDGSTWFDYLPFLWDFSFSGQGLTSTWQSNVRYYKIAGNEWGSPYSCDSLHLLGVEPIPSENSIIVYPNPFSEYLIIETGPVIGNLVFEISDITGKVVSSHTFVSGKEIINTANLKEGIYFYRISVNRVGLKTGRILKIR